jgi:hypothetical protein
MPDIIDAFQDSFTMAALTDAISHQDHLPNQLERQNLFESEGIASRTVIIEEDPETLALVPTAPYGGVPTANTTNGRKVRTFVVPHIPMTDSINATELQDVRAYAVGRTPSEMRMTVETMRDRKLRSMRRKLMATLEWHRLGALKGVILDANGTSVIYNLFTEFAVAQQTLNMAFSSATTNIRQKINQAIRMSLDALGEDNAIIGWRAICGNTFYDQFIDHAKVRDTYQSSNANVSLRDGSMNPYQAFDFGGVIWENYRGSVGGVNFVTADQAHLYPVKSGLFLQKNGPSDYIDRVNQIPDPNGLPIEVRSEMMPMGKGIVIEAQMNPLCICAKPRAVILLDNGATS